jgi:hypothetical protein
MFCERCHERDATCHSTTVIEGMKHSTDLCSQCFESSAPPGVSDFLAATKAARCRYCGGQPCAGGTDIFELLTGGQPVRFMCMPCAQELHRFNRQELERAPKDLSQQEQMAALRTMRDEAERHMQHWVSQRDSR